MKLTAIKKELFAMTIEELSVKKAEFARKLFDVKIALKLGKERDSSLVGKLRAMIARINTFIVQKNNQLLSK